MDSVTHAKISAHYNSIDPKISPNLRVRDALAGLSFAEQYAYGKSVMALCGY